MTFVTKSNNRHTHPTTKLWKSKVNKITNNITRTTVELAEPNDSSTTATEIGENTDTYKAFVTLLGNKQFLYKLVNPHNKRADAKNTWSW